MKRTAGTLVLHSLLPIGAIINMWFCTFLCFSVYLLGYSYLSVVMDHSHPSMASFWEVRTRFCSKQLWQKIDPKTALTKNWSEHSSDQRLIPRQLWPKIDPNIALTKDWSKHSSDQRLIPKQLWPKIAPKIALTQDWSQDNSDQKLIPKKLWPKNDPRVSSKESPWFYQSTLVSLLPPITALTLLWFVV